MSRSQFNKILFYIFLLLLFFLPFELPIAEGVHGVFRHIVGEAYPVLFVPILLLIVCCTLILTSRYERGVFRRPPITNYLLLSSVYLSIGLIAVFLTAIHGVSLGYSVKQFLLGYLSPVVTCFYFLLLDEKRQRKAWLTLYAGWVFFLIGGMVMLVQYWQVAISMDPSFADRSFGQKIFFWRYTLLGDWNYYGTYMGNANKMSNYLLLSLLLSVRLLGKKNVIHFRSTKYILHAFWILGVATLIVLFSRAALLLLPITFLVSGVLEFIKKKTRYITAMIVIASIVFAYSTYSDAINFLLFWKTSADAESNPMGSMESRFSQWEGIKDLLSDDYSMLLTGLGTAEYGERFQEGQPMAGTHNMFLDVVMESGIIGLAPLLLLVLLMLLSTLYNARRGVRDGLSLAAILTLIMLMTREYSIAYLFATSLGGFCFVLIFYILNRHDSVKIHTNNSESSCHA